MNNHLPKVIIGIINYNRPKDTVECLQSIFDCSYENKEVVVFDNGSRDNSVKFIRNTFPALTVIENKNNLGAAGARNQVIRWALNQKTKYLLMIDNDTVVEKGFLNPLVEAMEKDPATMVACGTILEYERKNIIWYGGGKLIPLRGMASHEHAGKMFNGDRENSPRHVSYITVCMTLYRCSVFEKIGLQDERYFVYLEDIEFAVRLQKNGYKQLYVPASVIYHKVQGERERTFKLYYCVRNRLLLIREGFGGVAGTFATLYFISVIMLKLVIWKIFRPDFYLAAKAGLVDYFKGNFGEGRGTTLFPDKRVYISTEKAGNR